jgi:NitT/TauT family transport system substrate-binding protein
MKKFISITLSIMMVLSLGLFASCGEKKEAAPAEEEQAAPTEFKLAFSVWVGYAPFYIAKEKGFFEKYNINPSIEIMEDESQYAPAMMSGNIQALGQVLDREIISYASGSKEKVLFTLDESSGGDGVIATADIKTVADLKGKTVGLDKSSTAYFFFLSVLQKNGLKESDVTINDMGSDDAGSAFISGKIDAAVTWEPYLSQAGEREGGHILATSKDYPKTILDVCTMNTDFLAENPGVDTALANAWYDAIDFYKENPDEGNQIMADGLGEKKEDIADMAAGVTFFGRDENAAFMDASTEENIFDIAHRAAEFWQERDLIEKGSDINAFISDTAYKG